MDRYDTTKIRIKFDGNFLDRFPPTILHGNIVNIYIFYEITSGLQRYQLSYIRKLDIGIDI